MKKNDNRKDDDYNNNNNNNNIIDESASSSNGGLGFLTGLFSPSTSNLNPNKEGKNDEDGGNDKSFVTYHIMYVLETLSTKVGVLRWNETEASAEQRIQESKLTMLESYVIKAERVFREMLWKERTTFKS